MSVSFHKFMMLVLEDFGGGLGVVKQLVDFLHLLSLHRFFALNSAQQTAWSQQLHGVPARNEEQHQVKDQQTFEQLPVSAALKIVHISSLMSKHRPR